MSDFLGDWQAWHAERESRLVAPHGFLSITGLHWLAAEPVAIDGLPGRWRGDGTTVVVDLGPGETLVKDGRTLEGEVRFERADPDDRLASHDAIEVEVRWRGDTPMVRPRDPDHPRRTRHTPTPTFAPDPRWVVDARMTPVPDEALAVPTQLDGVSESLPVAGRLEFEVDGSSHDLIAFDDEDGLWVLFADATSGVTTYGAGRQLVVAVPDPDGVTTIDFNRAFNLPCAYSEFTTCPFPPPGNRMSVAIEAGEKLP